MPEGLLARNHHYSSNNDGNDTINERRMRRSREELDPNNNYFDLYDNDRNRPTTTTRRTSSASPLARMARINYDNGYIDNEYDDTSNYYNPRNNYTSTSIDEYVYEYGIESGGESNELDSDEGAEDDDDDDSTNEDEVEEGEEEDDDDGGEGDDYDSNYNGYRYPFTSSAASGAVPRTNSARNDSSLANQIYQIFSGDDIERESEAIGHYSNYFDSIFGPSASFSSSSSSANSELSSRIGTPNSSSSIEFRRALTGLAFAISPNSMPSADTFHEMSSAKEYLDSLFTSLTTDQIQQPILLSSVNISQQNEKDIEKTHYKNRDQGGVSSKKFYDHLDKGKNILENRMSVLDSQISELLKARQKLANESNLFQEFKDKIHETGFSYASSDLLFKGSLKQNATTRKQSSTATVPLRNLLSSSGYDRIGC